MNNDIGIYKITCPNGFIYIGQSKNINTRFNQYKRLNCESQPKIYKSLIEKGVKNHKFEIIKNCKIESLNYWERYYQEKHDSVKNGLNSVYTTNKNKNKLFIMNELNKTFIITTSIISIVMLYLYTIISLNSKLNELNELNKTIIENENNNKEKLLELNEKLFELEKKIIINSFEIKSLKYRLN